MTELITLKDESFPVTSWVSQLKGMPMSQPGSMYAQQAVAPGMSLSISFTLAPHHFYVFSNKAIFPNSQYEP